MNKNVFYNYFEHWGMGIGGCERATLDDVARSFRFGKVPSIWLFCFYDAGLGFHSKNIYILIFPRKATSLGLYLVQRN